MDQKFFQKQIKRLIACYRGEEKNYPSERIDLFWRAFQNVSDQEFEEAVDECIGNQRQPPMFSELEKAIEQAKLRSQERRRQEASRYLDPLEAAAAKTNNKEFAKACLQIVRNKTTGRMNAEQFSQALSYLELAASAKREGRDKEYEA